MLMACWEGHEEVVRMLLAHAATEVNRAMEEDGRTPLIMACCKGHEEVVRLLLAHPTIEVNRVETASGCTALFVACLKGHAGVAQLLLENGAKKSIGMAHGETPYTIAKKQGHDEVAALLRCFSSIPVGSNVEVCGLEAHHPNNLNGLYGVVVGFGKDSGHTGELRVRIPARGGRSFDLKPENLAVLYDDDGASDEPTDDDDVPPAVL